MTLIAAKYYKGDGSNKSDYFIAIYENQQICDAFPHDYMLCFSKYEWKKMGGTIFRKENWPVDFMIKNV
jgi:hypothetical protein